MNSHKWKNNHKTGSIKWISYRQKSVNWYDMYLLIILAATANVIVSAEKLVKVSEKEELRYFVAIANILAATNNVSKVC